MTKRWILVTLATLCLLGTAHFPVHAQPPSQKVNGALTPLDQRRRDTLKFTDQDLQTAAENPAYPTPNRTLSRSHMNDIKGEKYSMMKALAVFGLVDMGEAPQSRIAEANAHIRYRMLGMNTVTQASQLTNANTDTQRWSHATRTYAFRIWFMYRDWLDQDLKNEYMRRFNLMLVDPINGRSENIRTGYNMGFLLAHEITGNTHLQTYTNVLDWHLDFYKRKGKFGFIEQGSRYTVWTIGPIANVMEFSEHSQLATLSEMALDHFFAEQATYSWRTYDAGPAIRCYMFRQFAERELTRIARVLHVTKENHRNTVIPLLVSNYRPLNAVDAMFKSTAKNYEVKSSANGRAQHAWRGRDFAMGSQQSLDRTNYFGSSQTHDVMSVFLQSAGGPENFCVPSGVGPTTSNPSKRQNFDERSFGYRNVAFVNHGGKVQGVWGAGGGTPIEPIRMYCDKAFSISLESGWAFFSDGKMYVAWAPTIGTPILETGTMIYSDNGKWVRSNHTPGNNGETAVIEAGDADSYGSFANFKSQIKSRNSRPRVVGGEVTYTAPDGAVLKFGSNYAKIDGASVNTATYPRLDAPDYSNFTINAGGRTVTFNFDAVTLTGDTSRLASNMAFGDHGTATNIAPTAPTNLFVGRNSAQAGASGDPVTDLDLTPVFSAIFNDDAGDTADTFRIQVHTDPNFSGASAWLSPDAGDTLPSVVNAGARSANIPYAGSPLDYSTRYYWRMIFRDQGGLWSALPSGTHSFTTMARPNTAPTAPSSLFIDSTTAQSGTSGTSANPVTSVDRTPVFSAIYNDPDNGDTADTYRIQVHDREDFNGESMWLTDAAGAAIGPVTEGNRSPDIAYGGSTLSYSTTYYWRLIFRDQAGAWSVVSDTGAFTTVDPASFPTITTDALPDARESRAYNFLLEATGGTTPYTFSILSGDLPDDLALNADGTLSGTVVEATVGDYLVTYQVEDNEGVTSTKDLTLTVAPATGRAGGSSGGGGGCAAGGNGNSLLPLILLAGALLLVRRR